jgi:hypothetical protein
MVYPFFVISLAKVVVTMWTFAPESMIALLLEFSLFELAVSSALEETKRCWNIAVGVEEACAVAISDIPEVINCQACASPGLYSSSLS